jgi:putative Ca2+/H+ antiporter (TMEM165/GDT1 family)
VDAVAAAFAVSFGVVFVAELGDKSQLLSVALTTRYGWRPVLVGIAIASVLMHGLAVLVGGALGAVLPERAVQAAGGVAFLVFGVLSLRPEADDDA